MKGSRRGYVDFRVCGLSATGGGMGGILCEEGREANGGQWRELRVETVRGQSPAQVQGALLAAIRGVLSDRLEAVPAGQDTVRVQSREGGEGRIVLAGCRMGGETGLFLQVTGNYHAAPPTAAAAVLAPLAPESRQLASRDGFVCYSYHPSRDYVEKRLQETKEFLRSGGNLSLVFRVARLSSGAVCGALWHYFGPPHDIHDDWKQSFSFYFDVTVQPSLRDPQRTEPVTLMLEVSDWKGWPQMQLRMPRRGQGDSVLEEGNNVLPEPLREEVLGYFLGFLEGYISVGPLQEFARRYAYSGIAGMRYGVKDGVSFDEAQRDRDREV